MCDPDVSSASRTETPNTCDMYEIFRHTSGHTPDQRSRARGRGVRPRREFGIAAGR